MTAPAELTLRALDGVPMVKAGDDLTGIILDAVSAAGLALQAGDVVVLAQKIVSKAEGRLVELGGIEPSVKAIEIAAQSDKDPRVVQLDRKSVV